MPQRTIVRVRDLTTAPRYTIVREIARLRRELERREVLSYFRQSLPGRVIESNRKNVHSIHRETVGLPLG